MAIYKVLFENLYTILTLLTMDLFWRCSWVGGGSYISYNDDTWHNFTLPKEDPKNIQIPWHTAWVLLASAFFTENQQVLLYQEIQI